MNKNKPFRIGCEIIPFASAIIFEAGDCLHIGTFIEKNNQFIDGATDEIYTPNEVSRWGYVSELLKDGDKKWKLRLIRSRLK